MATMSKEAFEMLFEKFSPIRTRVRGKDGRFISVPLNQLDEVPVFELLGINPREVEVR